MIAETIMCAPRLAWSTRWARWMAKPMRRLLADIYRSLRNREFIDFLEALQDAVELAQ